MAGRRGDFRPVIVVLATVFLPKPDRLSVSDHRVQYGEQLWAVARSRLGVVASPAPVQRCKRQLSLTREDQLDCCNVFEGDFEVGEGLNDVSAIKPFMFVPFSCGQRE